MSGPGRALQRAISRASRGLGAGWRQPGYGVAAELTARSRLHLVYRLTVRLSQLLDSSGGARSSRWRRLAAVCAASDVVIWTVLRGRTGLGLNWRLVLDAADTAVWSLAPYPEGYYDYAVLTGVPLAIEAGLARRSGGLVVPAVNLSVTALVRRGRHRSVQAAPFAWQLMAVGAGAAFSRYNRLLRRQVEDEWMRNRSAEEAAAYLAGQNDVAVGVNTVVDQLQVVSHLLGPPRPGSTLYTLMDQWRDELVRKTSEHGVYLKTVLLRWERRHNIHPDLSTLVYLRLPEGQGTTLLTGAQADLLELLLDACELHGRVEVRLANTNARRHSPGAPLSLHVNGDTLEVPADRQTVVRPPDVAPVTFLLGAIWFARTGMPTAEWVPVRALALPVAGTLAGAWSSERQLRRHGTDAHTRILWHALANAGVHLVLASRTMRRPFNNQGGQNFPFYASLAVPAILAGHYHAGLSFRQRVHVALVMAGLCLIGWLLARPPRQLRAFLLSLTWPLASYLPGIGLAEEFGRAAVMLAEQLSRGDAAATSDAFMRGRTEVIGLAEAAYDDALHQFERLVTTFEPDRRCELERRLEEVARRLENLRCGAESWSSTTMS